MSKQDFIFLVSMLIFFASVSMARSFVNDASKYYEPVKETAETIYGLGLDGSQYLRTKGVTLEGFHDPEAFGRWTSESTSVIGNLNRIVKGKIVNICGFAFVPNVGVKGVLNIADSKYDIEFSSEESCHDFAYNGDDVVTKIVIAGFSTTTPKEIGINNDVRQLGVAIKSIQIK